MNERLQAALAGELEALREKGIYKRFNVLRSPQGPVVEMEGRGEVLVLSSNNYLGFAGHPEIIRAGIEGLERYGAGTASVRFICGTFAPHVELERALAAFAGTEAALTYGSCWNANEAVIPSSHGRDDRDLLRRAEPREHRRRRAPLAPGAEGGVPALGRRRPPRRPALAASRASASS